MRILLFSSSYTPRTGGLETVTRRLARELADRGHNVLVATNRYPRNLPSWEYIDGIPVHRQFYPDILSGLLRGSLRHRSREALLLLLSPLVLLRLAFLILRFRPDIINAHYFSYPTAWILLVARLFPCPVVLSFHGSDLSSVPYPSNYEASLRLATLLSDGYTACSRHLLDYLNPVLREAQRGRAAAIHNGIDIRSFEEVEVPRVPQPFVLVSSRLVKKKGVRTIVETAAILRERVRHVTFVIAGDGPERAALERQAAELDVTSSVLFLGSVPYEVSRALAERAILVAVPSHWEAFGMVALEAMAAGKAVVASGAGGLSEIVVDGETGLLAPPGNVPAFAAAIESLINAPGRAAAMGARGRQRAQEHFTWSSMIDGYLDAYHRALEVPPRGASYRTRNAPAARRKILLFHPLAGHLWRGIERTVVCLASSLAAQGHEVTILTLCHPERALLGGLDGRVALVQVPRSRYFAYSLTVPFFAAHLLTHRYNAVITFFGGFGIGPAIALANRWRTIPLYICPCYPVDIAPHRYLEFERWGLPGLARQIWAAGEVVAQQASERFGREVDALPQGVDTRRFAPDAERRLSTRKGLGLPPTAPVLFTAAALNERKGIQHVIAALPALRAAFPDIIYLVAGEGEYMEALEDQIAGLGLQNNVRLLGPQEHVEPLYNAADLFCLLSYGEANPMVIYEALASGLPLVTSSHPPFPDILDPEVACLLPDTTPASVASALQSLLSAPHRREQMAAEGRRLAEERYSFDRLARLVVARIDGDMDSASVPASAGKAGPAREHAEVQP